MVDNCFISLCASFVCVYALRQPSPVYRPTVINCYGKDMPSMDAWWKQWSAYMFDLQVEIPHGDVTTTSHVSDLLGTIKKSKYPALTADEERISIPLQTLYLAVFDAILVHMLNLLVLKHHSMKLEI